MNSRSKSSQVWDYFESVPNLEKAVCKINPCQQTISIKTGSTQGLWKHLKSHHLQQYNIASGEKDKEKKAIEDATQKKMGLYVVTASELSMATSDAPSTSATTPKDMNVSCLSIASSKDSSVVQTKISDIFPSTEKYKPGHHRQKEINFLVGEWLSDALLPFNTVNNARFRVLLEALHSKYKLPTDKHFRKTVIPNIYCRVKAKIEQTVVEQIEVFTATTDMWSSQVRQSYISLTVHFINTAWERKMLVLACEPFFGDHTGANIAANLKEMISNWNLTEKLHLFLRDSGSNVISAMQTASYGSVPCFLHTLHLIVNAAVLKENSVASMLERLQSCVKFFKNSAKAKEKFRASQILLKITKNSLILGEPTRWSSYFQSISRALEQKRAIRDTSDQLALDASKKIKDEDWALMEQVKSLLEPFAEATTFAERENASISTVIPAVLKLRRQVTRIISVNVLSIKRELIAQIDKYFYGIGGNTQHRNRFQNIECNDFYTIATALDPRFKLKVFGAAVADAIREKLIELAYTAIETDQSAKIGNESPTVKKAKDSGFFADLEELTMSATSNVALEGEQTIIIVRDNHKIATGLVNSYISESLVNSDSDPLAYWKIKENELPFLAKLAKEYLSPPMGTVASEREFKVASDITSGDRMKLLPKNAEKLLFLKYNLRAIGYRSIRLPAPIDFDKKINDTGEIEEEEERFCEETMYSDDSDISENL